MIERVTIYGDSFADPNNDQIHPTWHGRLKERWPSTINLAVSGSGPMYSFKHFYQNLDSKDYPDIESYNYQDLIVFVLSGQNRLYFDIEEAEDTQAWCSKIQHHAVHGAVAFEEGIDPKCQEWIEKNGDKARFAADTFLDEILYGNWKYESLLYTASRIQKCKIFIWHLDSDESYINSSLNDEYFHVHDEGLAEASWNEYVEEERSRDATDDLYYRVNHLSEVNHEIMYKQVTGFVDGKEVPKFLKSVYRGTYKEDEFMYDGNIMKKKGEFVYD